MSAPRLAVAVGGLLALTAGACGQGSESAEPGGDLGSWEISCNNLVIQGAGFCLNSDHPDLIASGGVLSQDRGHSWWQPAEFPGDPALLTPEGGARCSEQRGPLGLAVIDAGGDRLYAAAAQLLLRSDDGGATWRELQLPVAVGVGVRSSLAAWGTTVVVQTFGEFYVSHDAGESFAERPGLPVSGDPRTVAVTPGGVWLADVFDKGIFASDDEGASWQALRSDVTGMLYAGPDGDVWILGDGGAAAGFWHSTDGIAWSRRAPTSGPFHFTGAGPGLAAPSDVLPLPGSRIAFRGHAEDSPTGRPDVVCVMGPTESTDPAPASLPEPPSMADVHPGEIVRWKTVTQGMPQLGALAVSTGGTPYVALATQTVSIGQELFFDAHEPDFIDPSCGGEPGGIDPMIVDLDIDPLTGALRILARPPTYYPQDWAELPEACLFTSGGLPGPWVGYVNPNSGALLGADLVGPVSCARPGGSASALAKCGNGACDPDDAMFCPDDCGVAVLCGNGVCDAWEQFHCPGDCLAGVGGGPSWGGTCGNLVCDDEVFEPGFCPGDCPPWPQGCPPGLDAIFVDPLALVRPAGVLTDWGHYELSASTSPELTLAPPSPLGEVTSHLMTRGLLGGDFFVLRDGWVRRYEPPAPDPCYVQSPVESAYCYPAPEGSVSALALSERTGHLYALLDFPGQLVRRPIDAETAPWELVVEALVRPVDLAILDTASDTRLFILDGDVWQAIPPESSADGSLPLVRSYD